MKRKVHLVWASLAMTLALTSSAAAQQVKQIDHRGMLTSVFPHSDSYISPGGAATEEELLRQALQWQQIPNDIARTCVEPLVFPAPMSCATSTKERPTGQCMVLHRDEEVGSGAKFELNAPYLKANGDAKERLRVTSLFEIVNVTGISSKLQSQLAACLDKELPLTFDTIRVPSALFSIHTQAVSSKATEARAGVSGEVWLISAQLAAWKVSHSTLSASTTQWAAIRFAQPESRDLGERLSKTVDEDYAVQALPGGRWKVELDASSLSPLTLGHVEFQNMATLTPKCETTGYRITCTHDRMPDAVKSKSGRLMITASKGTSTIPLVARKTIKFVFEPVIVELGPCTIKEHGVLCSTDAQAGSLKFSVRIGGQQSPETVTITKGQKTILFPVKSAKDGDEIELLHDSRRAAVAKVHAAREEHPPTAP